MATTPAVPAKKRMTLAEANKQLRETVQVVQEDRALLTEALSNAVAMLRQEDAGWAGPSEGTFYKGLELEHLRGWAQQIRASLTGTERNAPNPHMRNGLMLRHSFIWDGGIHYEGVPGSDERENKPKQGKANVHEIINSPNNQRLVFGDSARRKREHALYADGLYLLVGENANKKNIRPVPLSEITDTLRSELYEDEIIAYRWTRNEAKRGPKTLSGAPGILTGERELKHYWVYVDWFDGKKPDKIKRADGTMEEVLKGFTAFDLHANRPDGQAFGSPDSISAIVWARIIRDLIMNGVKMQDALAMFAFKATSKTEAGEKQTALELAKGNAAGSAAAMGDGNDLVPLNSAGKGYDFGSIGFVVATMAASLHVSGISLSANTALAGSSYGAAKTLDLPGRMAMETRRAEHIEFDERLLTWMGAPEATAYFDNYDDATDEYRAVQAAMLMWSSGNLTPEAFRAELEIVYGRKLLGSIPKGVMVPNNVNSPDRPDVDPIVTEKIDNTAAGKAKATKTTPAANQGKSTGAGAAGHANDIPVKVK